MVTTPKELISARTRPDNSRNAHKGFAANGVPVVIPRCPSRQVLVTVNRNTSGSNVDFVRFEARGAARTKAALLRINR